MPRLTRRPTVTAVTQLVGRRLVAGLPRTGALPAVLDVDVVAALVADLLQQPAVPSAVGAQQRVVGEPVPQDPAVPAPHLETLRARGVGAPVRHHAVEAVDLGTELVALRPDERPPRQAQAVRTTEFVADGLREAAGLSVTLRATAHLGEAGEAPSDAEQAVACSGLGVQADVRAQARHPWRRVDGDIEDGPAVVGHRVRPGDGTDGGARLTR
nr:hypothetical protein GCM10020092_033390 [Actinoplanes digitatis]